MIDLGLQWKRASKVRAAVPHSLYRGAIRRGVLPAMEHRPVLTTLSDVAVVLDVGANVGQFATVAREVFPSARIRSFEPLPGPRARLEALFRDDPLHDCRPVALSSSTGTREFHVTAADDSSSLLRVATRQLDEFPGTENVETVPVEAVRLDDAVSDIDLSSGPVLLKLDTQGTELDVLRGAPTVLSRAAYLVIEVSFVELYEGQDDAGEIAAHLFDRGWTVRTVYDVKTSRRSGEPLQADMVFQRRSID